MEEEIRIPGQPNTDVSRTNEILLNILSRMENQDSEVEESNEDIWHMSYPEDGTRATLTTGTTTLDFDAGTIMTPAGAVTRMSSSLRKRGKEFMQSGTLNTNRDVVLQFDNEDKIYLAAELWYVANNKEFTRLRVTTTTSTEISCMASTAHDAARVIGASSLCSCNVPVRLASGALTAGETTEVACCLGTFNTAVIRLDVTTITTPDADDEVDFYFQTSYNGGTDWADLEAIHFDTADNGGTSIRLVVLGPPPLSTVARVETDGTLADDTKNDLPLGDRLRIVTKVTGATDPTYAYSCTASFKV